MRNNTLAAIIASTLLTATATQAQPEPVSQGSNQATQAVDTAKAKWTQADTDSSGTLSVSEMQAAMPTIAENFAQMDTNSDGQVSRDEMHNYKTQHGQREWQKKFSTADINGDKMLDQSEASSMPMLSEQFTSVDTNKDGLVSTEEMRAHHMAMGKDMRDASKTLQSSDKTVEADEKRSTTSATSTTTTTTTTGDKADDTSTTTDR